MPLFKPKPTSPGLRSMVKVVSPELHKGGPYEPLLEKQGKNSGRNNQGRITVRHRGGGSKQRYRVIDFKRDKDGIRASVERIEYDPNRSAHIALLLYADGERRYIVAPNGIVKGADLMSGTEAAIQSGNCMPLRNIPLGAKVHILHVVQVQEYNWSPRKVHMQHCAYAQVKCVRCCLIAAPRSVKSAMVSIHYVL